MTYLAYLVLKGFDWFFIVSDPILLEYSDDKGWLEKDELGYCVILLFWKTFNCRDEFYLF